MSDDHPIRKYRQSEGLSQEALGEKLGRSWITIRRWELGQMPKPRDWKKLKDVTGIEAAELLPFVRESDAA